MMRSHSRVQESHQVQIPTFVHVINVLNVTFGEGAQQRTVLESCNWQLGETKQY
jgi:hypothetical protein